MELLLSPSHSTPKYMPRKNKDTCLSKDLHSHLHGLIIYIGCRVEKHSNVHETKCEYYMMEYYLAIKRELSADIYAATWIDLRHLFSERNQTQENTYYLIVYMRYPEKANLKRQKVD